MQSALGGKS